MPRKLSNWLQSFEQYVSQTESPVEYNTWVGISAISSTLKKNVCIPHFPYIVYPNQYIILVGPPGVGKGTAIHPAVSLVKDAQSANYLADRITAEKIVEKLSEGFTGTPKLVGGKLLCPKDNAATIVSTELPVFLQSSEWMLPLCCQMWDENRFEYSTKTKGSLVATDICVSIIGGCVPDYIRKLNRDATAAVTGGFTSRCIFVYASEKTKSIAWPSNNGQFGLLRQDLIDDLNEIGQLQGEIKFTPKAKSLYEVWYKSQKSDPFESEVLLGFKARMKSHIFKVAMALSVAESDNMLIDDKHLFNAIQLVTDISKKVDVTFRSVGESALAVSQEKVLQFIEKKGTVSKRDILRTLYRHMTADQLDQILYILEAASRIETISVAGTLQYTIKVQARSMPAGIGAKP